MIITANVYFKMSWETYEERVIKPMLTRYGLTAPTMVEAPVHAFVNHGIWIAQCECGGAEKVWEERVFMCQSCYNAAHKHQYRRVIIPGKRKQIEAILLKRPVPNRNYLVGETVLQLQHENDIYREELL